MRILLSTLILLCCNYSVSFSQESGRPESFQDFNSAFQSAVKLYQDKNFQKSDLAFEAALKFNPESVSSLINRALVQYQLGNKGFAIALFRKAQFLNPDFSVSISGLNFVLPQLETKEIPHEIKLSETIRNNFISKFSFLIFNIITIIFMVSGFILVFKFINKSRMAIENDQPRPNLSWQLILSNLLFLVFLTFSILKWNDLQNIRATIIQDKVSARISPDEKAPTLFDLFGGLEVIVQNTSDGWTQVHYPGGMTGWIPNQSLFITTGN